MKKLYCFLMLVIFTISLTSGCITDNVSIEEEPTDSDGDGVQDNYDACPNIPGDPTNQGCPTTTPAPTSPPATTSPPTTTPAPTTTSPPSTPLQTSTPSPTPPPTTTPAPTAPPTTAPPKGPVYRGTLELDIYDVPYIHDDNLLYYIEEIVPGTNTTGGIYDLRYVNLSNKIDYFQAALGTTRGSIFMLDNGAIFFPGASGTSLGGYYNIDDDRIESDLPVRTAEGHDDWWIVYSLRPLTYKQIYSQDLKNGREYTITTSNSNKETPKIYGTTVVYAQYNKDWDIHKASATGGNEQILSNMEGDEQNPKIYGNDVLFTLKNGSNYALYYARVSDGNSLKLSDSVGNYMVSEGRVLFYDKNRSRWIVGAINPSVINMYTMPDAQSEDSEVIALSASWAFVNGYLFKLTNL